jgi:hypothetical protein
MTYTAHPTARVRSSVARPERETARSRRLLNVERLAGGRVHGRVDHKNVTDAIARRQRVCTCASDVSAPRIATVVMNRWGILPGVMATLTGKTRIVTGGSRGIGLAIARALITSDVNVMITGTKQQPLDEALRGLADGDGANGERSRLRVRRALRSTRRRRISAA